MMIRLSAAATCALLAIAAGSGSVAVAQETTAPESETITVIAPRTLPPPKKRSPYTGAQGIEMKLSIPVLYNDLDLSTPRDAQRLMDRVEYVARDACKELDRLYPLDPDPDCVHKASANGKKAAKMVIEAAAAEKGD